MLNILKVYLFVCKLLIYIGIFYYIYVCKTLPIKVGSWYYRSKSIKPPPIKAPMTIHATIKGNSVLSTVKVIARITIAINHAINFHMITTRTMSFQLQQHLY